MAVKCTNCGGAHPLWDCSMAIEYQKKSVDAQKSGFCVVEAQGDMPNRQKPPRSGSIPENPSPIPKSKMGRPRTGYIKAEYNRLYSADKRKADKLGIKVSEYRKMKGNE